MRLGRTLCPGKVGMARLPLPTWNRYNLAMMLLRLGGLLRVQLNTAAGGTGAMKGKASCTLDRLKVIAACRTGKEDRITGCE